MATTFETAIPLTAASSGNGTAPSIEGGSTKTQRQTQGTAVGVIWVCRESAAIVTVQNQDATSTNLAYFACNLPTVSTTTGQAVLGANGTATFYMLKGDVLYGVAAADRAIFTSATPSNGF